MNARGFLTSKAKHPWHVTGFILVADLNLNIPPRKAPTSQRLLAPQAEGETLSCQQCLLKEVPRLEMPRKFLSSQNFFLWGGRPDAWKDLRQTDMILLIKNPLLQGPFI